MGLLRISTAALIGAGLLAGAAEAATIRFDGAAPGAGAPYLEGAFRFEPAPLGGDLCPDGGCAALAPGAAFTMTRADGGAFSLGSLAFALYGDPVAENEARGDVLGLRQSLSAAEAVAATAAAELDGASQRLALFEQGLLSRAEEADAAETALRAAEDASLLASQRASDAIDLRDELGAEATRLNVVQIAARDAAEAAEERVRQLEAALPAGAEPTGELIEAREQARLLRKAADSARDTALAASATASLAFDDATAAIQAAAAAGDAVKQASTVFIGAQAEEAKAQALVNGAEIERDVAAKERAIADDVVLKTGKQLRDAQKRLEALTASLTLTTDRGAALVLASGDFSRAGARTVALDSGMFGGLRALTFSAGPGGVATIEALSTVPLPASAWLMLGALGGLGALRRRRRSPKA